MTEARERFWTGPIRSVAHAERITRLAGSALGVIAALVAVSVVSRPSVGKALAVALIGALALSLYRTGSATVAIIVLVLFGLADLVVWVSAFSYAKDGDPIAFLSFALAVVWALVPLAMWRAFLAAQLLRKVLRKARREALS